MTEPRAKSSSFPGQDSRQTPALVETLPEPLRRPGALIMAAEARVRLTLSIALRQQGFSVRLSTGVGETLELYRRHPEDCDVVVLDAEAPRVNLTEVIQALRAVNPRVKCCLLTGTDGFDSEELARLGPVRIFRKPLQLDELTQEVTSLINQSEVQSSATPETSALQPVSAEPPESENRAFVRYRCGISASCQPLGQLGLGPRWHGQLLDISAGGTRLLLGRRFEPGTVLLIDPVDLAGDPSQSFVARVVRVAQDSSGQWSHGCVFSRPVAENDLRSFLS